jgi:EAL domain-containing protein (putative c-di-GMP-specific phosphodiesterase class I)
MSIIKYFLYIVFAFIVTFIVTFLIYFEDIKSDSIEEYNNKNYSINVYLKELLENTLINNDFKKIDSSIKTFLSMNIIKDIELEYKQYIFSKKAILLNSNKINNETYKLSDVTTDFKYGKVVLLNENLYQFTPNIYFDVKTPVLIKFQAFDDGDVYNSTSVLNFYKIVKNTKKEKNIEMLSWLDTFITFKDINVNKSFTLNHKGLPFVNVQYTIDKSELINETKLLIKKIFIYSFSLFLITLSILYIFYMQVVKKDIEKPISKIGNYIKDILNNQYVRLDETNTKLLHIDSIFNQLQMLSKKVASLTNESIINKNLLAKRDFLDEITGLDNKKVFDIDMKIMFASNKDGYIVLGKINILGEFASKHGSNDANNLINDFGHTIVNYLKQYTKINSKVYRFFGAEFAFILETNNLDIINEIMNKVTDSVQKDIKNKYLLEGDIISFGATPFDSYGTIASILHSAHEASLAAFNSNSLLFTVSDNAKLIEKAKKDEETVNDIIEREDFSIKFKFDTFEMDDEKTLIMQDASPIILDSETFVNFPIGVFISIAEKLNLSATFDRLLIEKVIHYVEYEKMNHKIVINLSIKSLNDKKFLSWLEGKLLYTENVKNNFIFSITSYNAKGHLGEFKTLIEILHKFDAKILLKRFSIEDFTLVELDTLDIDYIRLNKDYCTEINNDRSRKHTVKNIILYGEMNDIYIMGDSIKSDEDYKTMSRLGLYATSR